MAVIEEGIRLLRRQGRTHPKRSRFVRNVPPESRAVLPEAEMHVILFFAEASVRLPLLFHPFEQLCARLGLDASGHEHRNGLQIRFPFFFVRENKELLRSAISCNSAYESADRSTRPKRSSNWISVSEMSYFMSEQRG